MARPVYLTLEVALAAAYGYSSVNFPDHAIVRDWPGKDCPRNWPLTRLGELRQLAAQVNQEGSSHAQQEARLLAAYLARQGC